MRRIKCADIKDAKTRLHHIEKSGLGPVKIVLEVSVEDEEDGRTGPPVIFPDVDLREGLITGGIDANN